MQQGRKVLQLDRHCPVVDRDRVVLLEASGAKHLVVLDREVANVPGVGVVRADSVRGALGRRWSVGGRSFLVLNPSMRDTVGALRRQAQIIGPKDAASLVWNCDLKAGDLVVEVGAGSGAVPLVRALAGGPDGQAATCDLR